MLSHVENPVTSYTSNRPSGWLTMPIAGSNEIIMLIFANKDFDRVLFEIFSDSENSKTEDLTSSSFITSISYDGGKTYEEVTQHHLGGILLKIDVNKLDDKNIYNDEYGHSYKQAFVKIKLIRQCLQLHVHDFTRVMEIRCGDCLYLNGLSLLENPYIRFFSMGRSSITNLTGTFKGCFKLDTIVNLHTEKVKSMFNTFKECYSLKALPTLDMSSCDNAMTMFCGCHSLKGISLTNTFAVKNWNGAFCNCIKLIEAPIIDTMGAMYIDSMFKNCYTLEYSPEYNFSNVISAIDLFNNCVQLKSIPNFDFKSLQLYEGLFGNCPNITKLPPLNTLSVKEISSMDNGKRYDSIENFDIRNLSKGTSFNAKHLTFNYGEMEADESFIIRVYGMTEPDCVYEMITTLPTCKEEYKCTLLMMDYNVGFTDSMIAEAEKRNWYLTVAADSLSQES